MHLSSPLLLFLSWMYCEVQGINLENYICIHFHHLYISLQTHSCILHFPPFLRISIFKMKHINKWYIAQGTKLWTFSSYIFIHFQLNNNLYLTKNENLWKLFRAAYCFKLEAFIIVILLLFSLFLQISIFKQENYE